MVFNLVNIIINYFLFLKIYFLTLITKRNGVMNIKWNRKLKADNVNSEM